MAFDVVPVGLPTSSDDWLRAMAVPVKDLPPLNPSQSEFVGKFEMDTEQYTRISVVMRQFARERELAQGTRFGQIIEQMLAFLGGDFVLQSITRSGAPEGWTVVVSGSNGKVSEFRTNFDVVDALISGRASQENVDNYVEQIAGELGAHAAHIVSR